MSESTWSPAPATESLEAMRKYVVGYVLMPDDNESLDVAEAGIRYAINRLNARTWNWALTYDTITFVAGTQEYDLQRAFKAPRNFSLRDSSAVDKARLSYLEWGSFLKEMNYQGASGEPQHYSVNNDHRFGKLRLDVAPSAQWIVTYPTARFWYYRRVQYPGDLGGSIDVPSEVGNYILDVACGFTADRYAPQKAASAWGRAERGLIDLVSDDRHGRQTDWE